MATDITPGAPADQPGRAQPSQAKQASKRTSGQAAVIPADRKRVGHLPQRRSRVAMAAGASVCITAVSTGRVASGPPKTSGRADEASAADVSTAVFFLPDSRERGES